MRLNVINNYTYTLETIVQAGRTQVPITSVPSPTIKVINPRSIRVLAKIRDWTCPIPFPLTKKSRKRIPMPVPMRKGTAPTTVKKVKAHYTGLLYRALTKRFQVKMVSYKMQYPKFLFKKEQKDFSNDAFKVANPILNIF